MKVLAFKMISGEEVLARVNSTQEGANGQVISYEIESPMTLMVGQGGLGLIPWALANPKLHSRFLIQQCCSRTHRNPRLRSSSFSVLVRLR